MIQVYLDMDGVISNFAKAAIELHELDPNTFKHTSYNIEKDIGITASAFWRKIDEVGEDFWINMEVYPWVYDLTDYIKDKFGGFTILSSPSMNPNCVSGKLKWLHKVFGPRFRSYIFAPSQLKHRVAHSNTILIDDSDRNCRDFNLSGGNAILFPQPWNCSNGGSVDKMKFIKKFIEKEFNES